MKLSILLLANLALNSILSISHGYPTPQPPLFKRISNQISRVLTTDLNRPLGELFRDMDNFTRTFQEVASCYVDQLHGEITHLNIFNASLSFKTIVDHYYKSFPDKPISRGSISRLLNSTRDIITRCLDQYSGSRLKFGFTRLSDEVFNFAEIAQPDLVPPPRSNRSKRETGECTIHPQTTPIPATFDWRARGIVTPARDQRRCGSCWIFGAVASIESHMLRYRKTHHNSATLDLAEQQLVECENGCNGGSAGQAFRYIREHGIAYEHHLPYRAMSWSGCSLNSLQNRLYPVRDYCQFWEFTEEEMQLALLQHGPFYVAINARPFATPDFVGGVVDVPHCDHRTNHGLLLVGFTRDAWILKNSWGRWWGENGFVRVARGKNMCNINLYMAFPLLK